MTALLAGRGLCHEDDNDKADRFGTLQELRVRQIHINGGSDQEDESEQQCRTFDGTNDLVCHRPVHDITETAAAGMTSHDHQLNILVLDDFQNRGARGAQFKQQLRLKACVTKWFGQFFKDTLSRFFCSLVSHVFLDVGNQALDQMHIDDMQQENFPRQQVFVCNVDQH